MSREGLKEARRLQLIDATIDCIARRGFADLTLARVAETAGLSVGIVNFYFKSKDALLIATFTHMVEDYRQSAAQARINAGPSPVAQIDATIENDFNRLIGNRKRVTVWYAFWGEARWRPEFLRLCQDISDQLYTDFTAMFRQLIEDGGYRHLNADRISRGFGAMIDGLWLDILISPKPIDRDDTKQTVRLFLANLFPTEFGQRSAAEGVSASAA
jgi:TetR/AcrR family transcriptional repressor of bet genes